MKFCIPLHKFILVYYTGFILQTYTHMPPIYTGAYPYTKLFLYIYIYIERPLCVGVRYYRVSLLMYIGAILHRDMQNYSHIRT